MTRQARCSIAAFMAAMVAGCAVATSAHAFEPRVPQTFFGVSAPQLWAETVQNEDAERDRQLDGMKAAGIDWARIEIGWPEIEPSAPVAGTHSYQWAAADRLVAAMATRGMELLAMPSATPDWALSGAAAANGCGRRGEVAPGRVGDFAAFAAALVARYGRNGTFWAQRPSLPRVPVTRLEIWNEPNWNGFWCPTPNPEIYGTLLKQVADRIHAVDPGAEVLLGGLAALQDSKHQGDTLRGLAVEPFLQRAIASAPGLPDAIDAIAYHPYDIDPDLDLALVGWLRRKMTALGFAAEVDIVITEFGWRTGLLDGAISELLRASNYANLTGRFARTDCGITGVAAHTWQSPELDLLNPDHWYGLVNTMTGLLHPAGQAYRDQIALYEGRGPTPAPREIAEICDSPSPPDQDGDGTPDEDDDYPMDPGRTDGSGEVPPPPPDEEPEEPRLHAPRAADSYFGTTLVQLPDDFAKLGTEFGAIDDTRVGRVRMRVNWSKVEPVPPSDPAYDALAGWNWLDRIVLKLAKEGIGFVPAFGALPDWVPAGGAEFDHQYGLFLQRFAARYGTDGAFWAENGDLRDSLAVRAYEVWQYGNANQHAADGSTSPDEYASTYAGARAALRIVDPRARAVASLAELGVGGYASTFLKQMVAARPGLAGTIDGVYVMAEHSRDVGAIESVVRDTRFALDETGNGAAPIYLGYGAPAAGPGAMTEAARAQLYADVASRAARGDCGVAGVFAHAWKTPERDPTNPWDWFGIADVSTGALRGSGVAFRDVAAAFRGYSSAPAPPAAVHPCDRQAPDTDGDGTLDPADPEPLNPAVSTPTATPPPAPLIGGGPASSPTVERSATFSLAGTRAVGFQCKLDDDRFRSCGSSPTFSNLGHGDHELRVRSVDSLGLVGPAAAFRWSVDITGPNIKSVTGPGAVSLDSRVRFEFAAEEASAKLACRLDGHPWEWCTSPKVYPFVGDGPHEFRVAAIDAVGNIGPIEVVSFEVRTQPGPATVTGPVGDELADPTPRFTFTATYAAAYECRFDAAPWAACSQPGAHEPADELADGPHTFEVRGVGGTGKRGPAATRPFTIDTSGPAATIIPLTRLGGRSARFRFAVEATDAPVRLRCRLDRTRWRRCASPHKVRRLAAGRHTLRLRATDPYGNATVVAKRWRTRRR